ncbi:peptide-methionine (S)-S-oxide reductase MsrA [Paraburkholderia solisilvae]|uniref:Peptide methionine sulfoxide reductase MsrA n=1 Tax=Paraburkholderia solisilvae TaxID=624376 RepID=A0A6J5DWU8_9BURK|nr:peptide-methionine (S)-S-oxide reductase MsrA [Paraburkholderia solisilvae]CAB3758689.1 Peptide methionine sulfoxide reductase MsrA [Paraburkholderia solisilvae]
MQNEVSRPTSRTAAARGLRRRLPFAGLLAAVVAGIGLTHGHVFADEAHQVPPPVLDETAASAPASETVVLAGGCFWGVQGVFQHVKGVTSAVSGYTGGKQSSAEYETVSTGTTGHAESVRVTFDPHQISYGHILQIYFSVAHDPTELNRQGPDVGTQYRSTIFPSTPEQARLATAYIAQLSKAHVFSDKIVTTIEPDRTFYPAESYHQNYLTLHPDQPYIAINDIPKVDDLKKLFPTQYRDKPVLVKMAS